MRTGFCSIMFISMALHAPLWDFWEAAHALLILHSHILAYTHFSMTAVSLTKQI